VYISSLLRMLVCPQVYAAHPAGLVEMRKGPLQPLPTEPQQTQASRPRPLQVCVRTVTYLFVKPGELCGRYVPDKSGNGQADKRRQCGVGGQQRQKVGDNADLARVSDACKAGDPIIPTRTRPSRGALLEQGSAPAERPRRRWAATRVGRTSTTCLVVPNLHVWPVSTGELPTAQLPLRVTEPDGAVLDPCLANHERPISHISVPPSVRFAWLCEPVPETPLTPRERNPRRRADTCSRPTV